MTITIGAFSTNRLLAQPFGYEGEARTGLTARAFTVSGLLSATEWQNLISVYNAWRDLRITDPDTLESGTVGNTVSLTISSTNGLSVTSLACWFTEAPQGEQAGPYIQATAVLVDANQALQVILREKEKNDSTTKDLPNLGTVTLTRGSGTSPIITLTKPMETRQDGPNVALAATGVSYITGPLAAHKVRQIEGYISTGTLADVLSWYDETIAAVPTATSWFPVAAPESTAEVVVEGGVKSTRYNVTLRAVQII